MHKLFVYGTLKMGHHNHHNIENAQLIDTAHLGDHDMISLGGFPGIIPGKDVIEGELYEIDDDMLKDCDRLEGYREDRPDNSMYIRKIVKVVTPYDGESYDAFAYLWNGPTNYPLVIGGVW